MELSFHGRKGAQKSFLEGLRSQERVLGKIERRGQGNGKNGREGFLGKFGGKPKINFETSITLSRMGHNCDFQAYLTYLANLCNYSKVTHLGILP